MSNGNYVIRAFYKLFPFLADFFPYEQVCSVVVRGIDEFHMDWKGDGPGSLILLGEKGEEMGRSENILLPSPYSRWNPLFWIGIGRERKSESPRQLIDRLDLEGLVYQMLFVFTDCDNPAWVTIRNLCLCRAPEGFTVDSWILGLTQKTCHTIEEDLRKIDAKGNNIPSNARIVN